MAEFMNLYSHLFLGDTSKVYCATGHPPTSNIAPPPTRKDGVLVEMLAGMQECRCGSLSAWEQPELTQPLCAR